MTGTDPTTSTHSAAMHHRDGAARGTAHPAGSAGLADGDNGRTPRMRLSPADDAVGVDELMTAEVEEVLRRAVDLANTFGHRQVRVEHVALALLTDPHSSVRRGWRRALTAPQWQQVLLAALHSR
ncbi:Clp protease N-terminal domain-containing protein [Nocardia sp. NPDC051570]|uniref:Clp protease N-terminal domain-containing protein n=1 Tax=Nocardia sp. NPDC051570 TaxID=3364324 RepID=UPI00378D5DE8